MAAHARGKIPVSLGACVGPALPQRLRAAGAPSHGLVTRNHSLTTSELLQSQLSCKQLQTVYRIEQIADRRRGERVRYAQNPLPRPHQSGLLMTQMPALNGNRSPSLLTLRRLRNESRRDGPLHLFVISMKCHCRQRGKVL